ncbi:MAG: hypothetical protein IKE46_01990 [Selenomonadaceae bacterium]|nr:hypothetical protein [Selenomonadaceae bacterium]
MAMVISSQDMRISMGELNRNIKDTVRDFTKIITGQEINNAGDDSAKYSMSEKMRAKIRALEQGQQNAQNGMVMLTIAQEGIQEQLDILKTIKLRALQAADASASDDDRQWLQKEIEDGFKQIDDIAYDIELNGINLLTGNVPIRETAVGWKLLLTPQILEDSDMNLINDAYSQLDGLEGPFDTFTRYQSVDTTVSALLGNDSSVNLSGGADGTSAVFETTFNTNSASDLAGKGFRLLSYNDRGSYNYAYYAIIDSSDSTKYNTGSFNTIDIAGLDMNGAVQAIASKINSAQGNYVTASANGTTLQFTPKNAQSESNYASITGYGTGDSYSGQTTGREGATAIGLGNLKTSGGTNPQYERVWVDDYINPNTDEFVAGHYENKKISDGTKASLNFSVANATAGSGFSFGGRLIKFVDGNSSPTNSNGVTKVGLNYNGSISVSGFSMQLRNGQISITANNVGTAYNNYAVGDGFAEIAPSQGTLTGHGLGSLSTITTRVVEGVDGQRATYDIDLTEYDTTDSGKLEDFIDQLLNNSLRLNYRTSAASNIFSTQIFEFIDMANPQSLNAMTKIDNSTPIDVNSLRTAVQGGTTIADAFINLIKPKNSRFSTVTEDGKKILRVTSTAKGVYGNSDSLETKADQLSHYTLDFKAWAQENAGAASKNITRYLDGKGFRFYCATDTEHWFNFVFTSGEDEDTRPTGISGAHLETIPIDISELKDDPTLSDPDTLAKRLVEIIYEQGQPHLIADNHNLYFAMDADEGKLTVYDARKEDVLLSPDRYPNAREMGAKIGDGVLDDVQKTTVTVAANQRQLAIQHTDYSSQNILLHIPQTTINHIFSLDPDWPDYSLFNVTTQAGRNYLLGKTNSGNSSSAALNKGLEYLFNALTTVSAQNSMVRIANESLFTNYENEIAAESKIRDSDIAKSFVDFTKSNMLAKAAETMLAQATQNASKIIELLDRSKPAADKKSVATDKKFAVTDQKPAADKNSVVTDKKAVVTDKKFSDKKSALLGQIGAFTTQRNQNGKKNSSAQKSSTDKKSATQKNSGKK